MLDKFLTDKHLHWGAFRERKMGEGKEEAKLEPWCCYIVFSPKAYKSVLNPSP